MVMALGRDNRRRKKRTLIVPVDDVPVPDKAKTGAAGEQPPSGPPERTATVRMEPTTVGDADAGGDPSRRFVIKPPSQVLRPPSSDDMLVDLELAEDELEPEEEEGRHEGSEQELNIDDLEEIAEEAAARQPKAVVTSPPPAPTGKPKPTQPSTATAPTEPVENRVGRDTIAEPVLFVPSPPTRSVDIPVDDLDEDDDETLEKAEAEQTLASERAAPAPPAAFELHQASDDGGDEGEADEELSEEPPLLDLETGELTLSSRPEAAADPAERRDADEAPTAPLSEPAATGPVDEAEPRTEADTTSAAVPPAPPVVPAGPAMAGAEPVAPATSDARTEVPTAALAAGRATEPRADVFGEGVDDAAGLDDALTIATSHVEGIGQPGLESLGPAAAKVAPLELEVAAPPGAADATVEAAPPTDPGEAPSPPVAPAEQPAAAVPAASPETESAEPDTERHERGVAPKRAAEVDDDAPTFPPADEIAAVSARGAKPRVEAPAHAVESVLVGVIQVIGAATPTVSRAKEPAPVAEAARTHRRAQGVRTAEMFVPPPPPVSELENSFDDSDDEGAGEEYDDRVTSERRLDDIEAELRSDDREGLFESPLPVKLPVAKGAKPADAEDEAEELDLSEAEEVPEAPAAAGDQAAKKAAVPPRPVASISAATPTPAPAMRVPRASPAPPPPSGPVLAPPPPPGQAAERETPSVSRRRRRKPWWEEIFNDDYLRSLPKYSPRQTQKEVDFIEAALGIKEGGMILDLACGNGRHAVELSNRGFQVVGLDLSLPMLARAAELAQKHGQKINFIHGDMRQIAFEATFDGACCLGTSFGFFDDETNIKVIDGVRRALKARGMLVISTVNRDYIIGHQPNMVWFEGDGCVCMEESSFNFITSRLKVKRTLLLEGGRQVDHEYSVRVYCLHELGKILHNAGFRVIEVSGHIHTPGAFFGADSTDLVILAEKRLE
jgi:SAM-dependent methyltransferase